MNDLEKTFEEVKQTIQETLPEEVRSTAITCAISILYALLGVLNSGNLKGLMDHMDSFNRIELDRVQRLKKELEKGMH